MSVQSLALPGIRKKHQSVKFFKFSGIVSLSYKSSLAKVKLACRTFPCKENHHYTHHCVNKMGNMTKTIIKGDQIWWVSLINENERDAWG